MVLRHRDHMVCWEIRLYSMSQALFVVTPTFALGIDEMRLKFLCQGAVHVIGIDNTSSHVKSQSLG
jgi:hypothetical protein